MPAFKIASFENNHLPLIKKAAATGKPVIISTGMASLGELEKAVSTAREAGCEQLILLKCTSTYPATPENTNILTIPHLKHLFGAEVGLSDHTMGVGVAVASVALGASVIEKHFTLSRAEGGVDSAFFLSPQSSAVWLPKLNGLGNRLGRFVMAQLKQRSRAKYFDDLYMLQPTFHRENCLQKLIFELLGLVMEHLLIFMSICLERRPVGLTGQEHLEPGPAVVTLVS